ncbi:MAG: gliding motility-associated ABC transporter ATP-binding subunit GldA [Cytophagaceae bacterium]|jgi:ABC-2 type transport system ATP-binding protein|nr:gliding motility-associated ABC transporter ATP-binding subunit GldA [Cytophagaceae bacterium]
MSISVTNVSRFYRRQQALKNVSFNINSGEVVGFLGPNGAGKSTMMKILTGFLPPSSGKVFVAGENVQNSTAAFRRKIGYLPEHNPLYSDMYVSEYFHFVASIYNIKAPHKIIEEMIDRTGLSPERNKKISALSKGYRQRVGLAQALLPNPEVLILDEPTTGLDPNQIAGVRSLIKDMGQSKTILLSTHIMQEVKAICERVIIIHNGLIVADDKTDNIENMNFDTKEVVEVEFNRSISSAQLLNISGVANVENMGNIYTVTATTTEDVRPLLFRFAVENNMVILSMTRKHQSLEDVFHTLTAKK